MEAKIRERVERLDRLYPRIIGCRVAVECDHRHQHKGKFFHVRLDLTVPGQELVISRDPEKNHAHEDAYVAIRDAFDAMERRLESFARRRRGEVKTHEAGALGVVSEITPDFGRIDAMDGRSLYFHRNSVVDDAFELLDVGSRVRYMETADDEGVKASTVVLVAAGEARL
jgi:ribosome-associated translation inhibitor RaiA